MPSNLKSVLKCLIMIQAVAVLGCKTGSGGGNSSLKRGAVKPVDMPASALAKQAEKLIKGYEGELTADSYTIEEDGNKQDRSKARCSFKALESNGEYFLDVTLGSYSTKLPITKGLYEENFKKVNQLNKPVQTKSVSSKNKTITFSTIQSTVNNTKRALSYDQARYVFSENNLDLENMKTEQLDAYRQILIKDSETKEVGYFRETFLFLTKGRYFMGIDYTNNRYVNGSAAKKNASKIEDGEFKTEAILNCRFPEEREDKTSEAN